MIRVHLTAEELLRHNACDHGDDPKASGMALHRQLSELQGTPGVVVVEEWTPLHSLWFLVAYPSHWTWMVNQGLIPGVGANLAGANLADANLAGANLAGANLVDANLADANLAGANLAGAHRSPTDPPLTRWKRSANGTLHRKSKP